MATSTKKVVSFKLDRSVHERATKAAKALGLPLSTIVNQNLKRFSEVPVITFGNEVLLPKVAREIRKDLSDARKGKNVSPAFRNAKDAVAWLRS